jgi:uncharacterized membrane protein
MQISVRERRAVAFLCALAGVRVIVHTLAFPLFDNMDEQLQFDLVVAYSRGHVPHAIEPIGAEAAATIARFGSPEYFAAPEDFPDGHYPPPSWSRPVDEVAARLASETAGWRRFPSQLSLAPPLYYAIAGGWLAAGRALGLGEAAQPYWVRALNAVFVAALVGLSYAVARRVFSARHFASLAVPALVALLPQDAYYSIQSEALSPLVSGAAFLGLLVFARSEVPDVRAAGLTGVALAATGLTHLANLPLLAAAGGWIAIHVARRVASGALRPTLPALIALTVCAALPFGAWLVHNQLAHGDFTGSAARAALQTWTRKPISQWWPHPIFTLPGLALFWQELSVSLWRGEIIWHGRPLAWRAADLWYCLSSALFLAVAALRLLPRFGVDRDERGALAFALACFGASLAYLAMVSVAFDFGESFYPSRDHPFFTSGRYLSCVLVPYALLYVAGLETLLARVRADTVRFAALGGILLFATVSEVAVNRVAFASDYNAFALWRAESPPVPR